MYQTMIRTTRFTLLLDEVYTFNPHSLPDSLAFCHLVAAENVTFQ